MRWLLSLIIAFNIPVYGRSHGQTPFVSSAVMRQMIVGEALDTFMPKLAKARVVNDLVALTGEKFSAADKKYAETFHRDRLPKFERLNRGVGFWTGGKFYSVVVEDIFSGELAINSTKFRYDRHQPLSLQVENLRKRLDTDDASFNPFSFFLPEAHAQVGLGALILAAFVGSVMGVAINNTVGTVITKKINDTVAYYDDKTRAKYCKDKNEASSFEDQNYCAAVFKLRNAVAKGQLPNAKAGADVEEVEWKDLKLSCQSKSWPELEVHATAKQKDGSETPIDMVMKFDPKTIDKNGEFGPPVQIRSSIYGPDFKREDCKVIAFKGTDIDKVTDCNSDQTIATGDRDAISKFSIDQATKNQAKLDEVRKRIDPSGGWIAQCNDKIQKALEAAARQPGSSSIAEEVPMVPAAPGGMPAATR